jgi:hypothetical protein
MSDVGVPGFGTIVRMTGDRVDPLQARLRQLAMNLLLSRTPVTAEAVNLACDLLVADRETPATVDVAALHAGTTLSDSEALMRSMLSEQGIDVPPFATAEEQFVTLRRAFGYWHLPLSDFEGPFYERLPEWDAQDPLDRVLVVLLDQRDHQADPARRAEIEERMRGAIRELEPEAAG